MYRCFEVKIMNKKSKLLALSLVTSALCVGVTALLARGGSNLVSLRANGDEYTGEHTILYNSVTVDGAYDEGEWSYCLSFDGQVQDSDGNWNSLNSYDGIDYTSIMCTEGSVKFNETIEDKTYPIYIATSEGYEALVVSFHIIKKATFDCTKSVIDYYVDGDYQKTNFYDTENSKISGYNLYQATFDCYSDYGKEIKVEKIKLVFSC